MTLESSTTRQFFITSSLSCSAISLRLVVPRRPSRPFLDHAFVVKLSTLIRLLSRTVRSGGGLDAWIEREHAVDVERHQNPPFEAMHARRHLGEPAIHVDRVLLSARRRQ